MQPMVRYKAARSKQGKHGKGEKKNRQKERARSDWGTQRQPNCAADGVLLELPQELPWRPNAEPHRNDERLVIV
jgi:hypothetical protein